MKVHVEFLQACADWPKGATDLLEKKRADRLVRTGYARVLETATVEATERAEQLRPAGRGPRTERRA